MAATRVPNVGADRRERDWTVGTYATHNEVLRIAEAKFQEERDRRYSEVATEREKALKIKETADLAALGLAREIQTYKDEKANELREQISSERGNYATKGDLRAAIEKVEESLKPIASYVSATQGQRAGITDSRQFITWLLGIALALIALYTFTQRPAPAAVQPQIIYTPAPPGTQLPSAPPASVPR